MSQQQNFILRRNTVNAEPSTMHEKSQLNLACQKRYNMPPQYSSTTMYTTTVVMPDGTTFSQVAQTHADSQRAAARLALNYLATLQY